MKKINSDLIAKVPFIHDLSLNKSADKAVYSITRANLEKNCYDTNLWVYDIDNDRHFQLTNSQKDQSYFFQGSNTVIFASSREESEGIAIEDKVTSFYEINLNGGEARKAFDIKLSVSKIQAIDKDKYLIKACEFKDRPQGYHEINDLPFWSNGSGYIYDQKQSLYTYNCADNSLCKLTGEDKNVEDFAYSVDSNLVVFSYSNMKTTDLYSYLNAINLKDKKESSVKKDGFSYAFFDFIEDKIIFAGSYMNVGGINEDAKIYTIGLDGQEEKMISKSTFDMSLYNSTGTDMRYGAGKQMKVYKDKLYFVATERDHAYLNSIDLDGNVEKIIDDKKSIEMFDIENNKLIFSAFDEMNLAEIFLRNSGKDKKVSHFSTCLEGLAISNVEHFTYHNDGLEFDGYVLKPLNYVIGNKYPALLEIHGGPKTAYSDILHHEMQFLANHGYFVFYTNPRGSSGRGDKFSDIRGKYGTIDYDDLMKFTDEVLVKYEDIDRENIGVLGGSYGGFMTNWIIGHTNRFKAANTQRCISNWTSFYGVSDIGFYFAKDQNNSTPWDNFDLLWKSSPLKYFNKVTTPTLIIHSDQDYRCPLEQGIQAFNALKVFGVDTKMVIFNGENHELSRSGKPQNRIKRLDEILAWFDKYLKK